MFVDLTAWLRFALRFSLTRALLFLYRSPQR